MPAKASKFDANDPATASLIAEFQSIGLTQAKATDMARNPKNASSLSNLINANSLSEKNIESKRGSLLTTLAVSGIHLGKPERTYITRAIVDGRLKTSEQVAGTTTQLVAQRFRRYQYAGYVCS